MDFQQPHGYMRPPHPPPPPPSVAADPYYHHQAQRPPLPPPNPWYSAQFQFQHASSSPQPPPPPPPPPQGHVQPPPHQQWAPAPQHSDQFVPPHHPYPTHPPPYTAPYPAPPNHYPHPPPHSHASLPPRPPHIPVAPHISQSYPQEWGHANWGHQQSWEYQANNNEEVWAAKARAWAASKVASDDQQSQHPAYAFKDGSTVGDSAAAFSGRDSSISPSVHQQEVPSSYSSVAGDPARGMEHVAAMPPDYSFVPPAEPALIYPPSVPVMLPAGSQVDPAVNVPSPVPGHSAPLFGRMPGPSFQPTVSPVAVSFGIGVGPELHHGAPFSGDSFGVPVATERPKKASVPNWLREEIIKNKPVIVSSAAELPKDDVESTEGDSGKGDQKSLDSRSTEEEEDDEEDLEAARTAAINQEIKRIVTDVLLQVTAELFDEIATKVLSEDDPNMEDSEVPTSTLSIANAEATSTVPLQVKSKETASSDASEKFDSTCGDVLGLASYASDDDDSDRESSDKHSLKEHNLPQQSTSSKLSKGKDVVDNGGSKEKVNKVLDNMESDLGSSRQNAPTVNHNAAITQLMDEGAANTSNGEPGVAERWVPNRVETSKFNNNLGAKDAGKNEKQVENHSSKKSTVDGFISQDIRDKLDKNDRHDQEMNSSDKSNNAKELEISKESVHERREEMHSRHDERHKKERKDVQNGLKERGRDKVLKSAERAKDSDSRKRISPDYAREGRRERQTDSRAGAKEENDGKRVRTKDDKREKPREKDSSESGRHNKRHASSVSSRDRDHRDGGHVSDSSDESSDDSKKKLHSRRRRSPSPVRSRKRHVSRSPHSKHSQRRHSPFSSLETSRGKKSRSRSRSRSPARRKR